ncbi:MAG TPA: hypothetical protein VFX76_00565 [Roseiflexaceae bacterium]|nr:hypothetical protein [Roseiflexaceae bacterium]
MTLLQRSDSSDPAHGRDPIVDLTLRCQQCFHIWKAATGLPQHEACGAEYRAQVEELWIMLADDLRRVARGWIHSHIASDLESLAMNLFGNIVLSLPRLRIDPNRNVRNLLLTVARRGQIDDYWRAYSSGPQQQTTTNEQVNETQMWQQPGTQAFCGASFDMPQDIIDPASLNIEEHLVAEIDQQAILETVWREYWPSELSALEFTIMELRWRLEPPKSFRQIAEHLGKGWSEDAVRQRHFRIITATRAYLRERGLID